MMIKKISGFIFCLFYILVLSSVCYSQQLPPELDNYVQKVMKTFHVPGVSLAIVKDGKILLTKGYGVKEMGKDAPVDSHTLFCIASNSKAFTATALGILAEEGKIHWDDPVINYLPWFRMNNPYVTTHMTIRDLLVHHSGLGLGASDLLQFPPSNYSRKEMTEKLRYVPLKTSFRNNFAYDNILYLVAGEVIHAASGMTWEDFIKKNIIDKIGMMESIDQILKFDHQPNVAVSNIPFENKVIPNPGFPANELTDASNPAGGIASNAVDMSKW
ncbi:MAG: serine hydrolase domain-containing protein, partial [Chitinophagaceae bacterium]